MEWLSPVVVCAVIVILMVLDAEEELAAEVVADLPPQPMALPPRTIARTSSDNDRSRRNSLRRLDDRHKSNGRSANAIGLGVCKEDGEPFVSAVAEEV